MKTLIIGTEQHQHSIICTGIVALVGYLASRPIDLIITNGFISGFITLNYISNNKLTHTEKI